MAHANYAWLAYPCRSLRYSYEYPIADGGGMRLRIWNPMNAFFALRWLFVLALLGQAVSPAWAAASKRQPNIVYFLADDLGWADVGYHGSDIKTPSIDKLASSGAKLESFYAQPVCSPTRAALMTGRYPIRYGLQTG